MVLVKHSSPKTALPGDTWHAHAAAQPSCRGQKSSFHPLFRTQLCCELLNVSLFTFAESVSCASSVVMAGNQSAQPRLTGQMFNAALGEAAATRANTHRLRGYWRFEHVAFPICFLGRLASQGAPARSQKGQFGKAFPQAKRRWALLASRAYVQSECGQVAFSLPCP